MRQKFELVMCVLLGFALTFPACAQMVTLEVRETQLMQAMEAAQQAEAKRKAEAERKAEAARRAAAAAQGTLVVRADGDCALTVNGQAKGRLQADSTTTVKVSSGEQLIECDAGNGRRVEAIETIASGEQKGGAAHVTATERFTQVADGVEDNEQGIVWASSDNGSNIDWNGATSYCASKGSGWSLPTSAQAQSMFDSTGKYAQPRSGHGTDWTIKPATDLIQFSQGAGGLWTSERDGSSSAFYVPLDDGIRYSNSVSDSDLIRALCVRRRS